MRKRILFIIMALVLIVSSTACSGGKNIVMNIPSSVVIEQGSRFKLAALSSKASNVDRYVITALGPDNTPLEITGNGFTPEDTGSYVITYKALDKEGKIIDEKSTLLTVVKSLPPVITVKENLNNVVWQYGKTFVVPKALVTDNVDSDLTYSVKVEDASGAEVPIVNNRITIGGEESGYYKIIFTASDSAGNETTEEVMIYTTGKYEISAFETPSFMSKFQINDDNGDRNVTYSLSYNTDKDYTYGNSNGSLKAHFDTTAAQSWPGVVLLGDNMPVNNLFTSDFGGIKFNFMFDGTVSDNQSIWCFVYSDWDPASANFVEGRILLSEYAEGNYRKGEWLTLTLTKQMLSSFVTYHGDTPVSFNNKPIYRIKIWTMVEGENQAMDLYLDNFEYID